MFSVTDLLSKYEHYSDEELYHIYSNSYSYSTEAQEALGIAINKRGGVEKLKDRLKQKELYKKEAERILQETAKLCVPGAHVDFLKTLITSDILPEGETHQIIEKQYQESIHQQEDKKIKPRTILGSLIGGALASVIGGVLWGLQMIQMHRIFYIFLIGLFLLSYGLIRLFTGQSKANIVVMIFSALSVMIAVVIGQLLYNAFG